jgi:hypothetical protein
MNLKISDSTASKTGMNCELINPLYLGTAIFTIHTIFLTHQYAVIRATRVYFTNLNPVSPRHFAELSSHVGLPKILFLN